MIRELLLSVDISNRDSILSTISYLYSIVPATDDEAFMTLDYNQLGDPFNQSGASHAELDHQ
jgi:hypothetical protein